MILYGFACAGSFCVKRKIMKAMSNEHGAAPRFRRTWAEIDLDAITWNVEKSKEHIAKANGHDVKMMCVVKSDAYGYGAREVAKHLESIGVDYLGVACIDEAEEIRTAGVRMPIHIFGDTPASEIGRLLDMDLDQTVHSLAYARALNDAAAAYGRKLRVQIELDTGMGRMGFLCEEDTLEQLAEEITEVVRLPWLEPAGIFAHFAVSDDPGIVESEDYTRLQYARFQKGIEAVEAASGFTFPLHHCCNSGGIAFFPHMAMDMVRNGIITYGMSPMADAVGGIPAMTVKTTVSVVRTIPAGNTVSYGRTFTAERETRIAVLPIGYGDGLVRLMSNHVDVMTPYGRAPQIGRICMDVCMIDVTDLPEVKAGDVVEVYGRNITAQEDANRSGTIAAELTCCLPARVPRLYYRGGELVCDEQRLLQR